MQEKQSVRQPVQQNSNKNNPLSVAFIGDKIEVSAVLWDQKSVDKLIAALTATKALLPEETEQTAQTLLNDMMQ